MERQVARIAFPEKRQTRRAINIAWNVNSVDTAIAEMSLWFVLTAPVVFNNLKLVRRAVSNAVPESLNLAMEAERAQNARREGLPSPRGVSAATPALPDAGRFRIN